MRSSQVNDALVRSDEMTREERARRLEWLAPHMGGPGAISGAVEALALLEEARVCFIQGQFIATLLVATSFIEHTLAEELEGEFPLKKRPTVEDLIKAARTKLSVPVDLLDRTDRIRRLRNPYTHLRPTNDPDRLGNRYREERRHPNAVMEDDAKLAISTMREWFMLTLRPA